MKRPIRIRPGTTGWLLVELPYTPERVEKIKTISNRQWLDEHKCWAIPQTARTLDRLKALFSGDDLVVGPELNGPKPSHMGQRPTIRISPGSNQEALRTFILALKNREYSPHTIDIYALHVRRFLKASTKTAQTIDPQDVKHYLHTMHTQEKVAETYHNQAIRALKTFLTLGLDKNSDFLKAALPPRRMMS